MPAHQHSPVVLEHLRSEGLTADFNEHGDIVVEQDGQVTVVGVNDEYVYARVYFRTDASAEALATLACQLHQRLLSGRLVYPTEGGIFAVDTAHRYTDAPSRFDALHPVAAVQHVARVAAALAEELGLSI